MRAAWTGTGRGSARGVSCAIRADHSGCFRPEANGGKWGATPGVEGDNRKGREKSKPLECRQALASLTAGVSPSNLNFAQGMTTVRAICSAEKGTSDAGPGWSL